jgi:exopolysaccharide biosynthesis polyprenyl glycosylphosphotransferase
MVRVFHHYVSGRKLAFFCAESVAMATFGVAGAGALALLMSPPGTSLPPMRALMALATVAAAVTATFHLALYLLDLYDMAQASADRRAGGGGLLKAAGATAVAVGAFAAGAHVKIPPGALLGCAFGALLGAATLRALLRALLGGADRVVVLGSGVKARALTTMVHAGGEGAFVVCAMLESPEGLEERAQALGARYVVMAMDEPRGTSWVDALIRCRLAGLPVYEAGAFCERVLRRLPVVHLRPADFAFADRLAVQWSRRFAKRAFDVAVAFTLLVLFAPAMLLVAIAVKLESRGPLLYGQDRVGRGGKAYRLWKFRSMGTDAEPDGAVWASKNDQRVTRVGRLIRKARLDETPQFLNVLLGDMSFVGPRPERPVFVNQLKEKLPFYDLRHALKPGITGWAQIRYPYGASVEDAKNKLEHDLYYVKHGSLFLDLSIIFHTARHVLTGRGAR